MGKCTEEPNKGAGWRWREHPPVAHGALPAEPRRAADCLQRPLRSRFRQQLTSSVAMTSDVKGGQQIFFIEL